MTLQVKLLRAAADSYKGAFLAIPNIELGEGFKVLEPPQTLPYTTNPTPQTFEPQTRVVVELAEGFKVEPRNPTPRRKVTKP